MSKTSDKPARFGTMFVHDCSRIAIVRDEEGAVHIRLYGDRLWSSVTQLSVFGNPELSVTTDADEERLVLERYGQLVHEPAE
jgi:hypothetical protein